MSQGIMAPMVTPPPPKETVMTEALLVLQGVPRESTRVLVLYSNGLGLSITDENDWRSFVSFFTLLRYYERWQGAGCILGQGFGDRTHHC